MMAKARAKRAAIAAHAKLVKEKAIRKAQEVKEAQIQKKRAEIAAKLRAAMLRRRNDEDKIRRANRNLRDLKRTLRRDTRAEHGLRPISRVCKHGKKRTVVSEPVAAADEKKKIPVYSKKEFWIKEKLNKMMSEA